MPIYFYAPFLILYCYNAILKVACECNFSNTDLSLLIDSKSISDDENENQNNEKICIKNAKSYEFLTFICPKKSPDYIGIEIRPFNCFETVKENGINKDLSRLLKGSFFESKETESTIIRKVFIPPSIVRDMVFECICDNNLTFKDKITGAKGIMKVQLKKNKIFGCDFDYNPQVLKESAFVNYYEQSLLNASENFNCDVKIINNEVDLGLICPEEFTIYPEGCFENVLYKDKIVKLNELIPHDLKLHSNKNKRIAFVSFILDKNEKIKNFSCKCIKDNISLSANFVTNLISQSFKSYIFGNILLAYILVSLFFF